jgi:hypothetical protein
MKFSAGKAQRKWPCGTFGRTAAAILVTTAIVLATLGVQAEPAAAKRPAPWLQGPWGDLFGPHRPKLRRAALPAPVPLPKPRPAEAPVIEPEKPAVAKQTPPPAEPETRAERAATAPPRPRYQRPRRLRRRGLVRLEAVVLETSGCGEACGILRCPAGLGVADSIRTDMTPVAARCLGSVISDLDNFDCSNAAATTVAGAQLSARSRQRVDVRAEARRRPVDLAYRPHGAARSPRACCIRCARD